MIFISYRRADSSFVSGLIHERLAERYGSDAIFTDIDSIPLGVNFKEYIDRQVGECDILLAVIGNKWLDVKDEQGRLRLENPDDVARLEIESALNRGIPVIPLLIGDTKLPSRDQLPDSLKELTLRNGTTIRPKPTFDSDMAHLIRGIDKHVVHLGRKEQADIPRSDTDESMLPELKHEVADSSRFSEMLDAEFPAEFECIRMLGKGTVAHVFLARNKALKRLVALKVLRKELASDPLSRKRFVREAQASARLSHPSVTAVYSVGNLSNDIPYIEMQYVKSNNLAEILRSRGRFDAGAARVLLTQLADALAAAHDHEIIHRDVKPTNVLVEHDTKRAFLTDFGLAGILESGSEAVTRLTKQSQQLGDPTYMSPDQLRGETLTGRSDVYSLGIIGYEILTLGGPFDHADVTNPVAAHLRHAPLDLHVARPDIPADLSATLKQCLSKKPEHRPRAKDLASMFSAEESSDTRVDTPPGKEQTPQTAFAGFLHALKRMWPGK